MTTFDVAVVGLGVVGAASVYQLARRGSRVVGIDMFHPPHTLGSSHGETRITRLALGEGEAYVALAKRSHEIWRELEAASGTRLLHAVGGLVLAPSGATAAMHGAPDFFGTTVAVAQKFGIRHEVLSAAALASRFGSFLFQGDERGYFEPEAGYLLPEACVETLLARAAAHGAGLRYGERCIGFSHDGDGVAVRTSQGTIRAARVILAAGAWMKDLVAHTCTDDLRVYRQVLGWFEPEASCAASFAPERMPVFIWVPPPGEPPFYGFPAVSARGVKVATEQFERASEPSDAIVEATREEVDALYRLVSPRVRIGRTSLGTAVCRYTATPDFDFLVDTHPESDRVLLASPCSGHGFKHAAALGEALAEWTMDGRSRIDLGAFQRRAWRRRSQVESPP